MYSSWKLCISKIKRNKSQNILIFLIILLSTLLLATALVMINNTSNSYLDKHNELNGSHEILELENGIHNPDEINAWWKSQNGVITSDIIKYRTLLGFTHKNENINVYLYMVDASSYSGRVDRLLFTNGNEQETPDLGSIWIPTSLAYSNDISVGDELSFQTDNGEFNLKVTGIVVDLPYCSPFSTNARIWMNGHDYQQYVHNTQTNDYFMMSFRFDDYSASRNYWSAFEEYLGTPYLEYVRNFESLSSFYMVINKIIGFIMIFLAAVMLIIAIASIGFTISDDIISNYKTIGIIKSLGMPPIKSIFVYVFQYALLTGFSSITGIVFSYFLSGAIIKSSLAYLRADNSPINIQFADIAFGVFVCLFLSIILSVFIFAYKTRRIQPVQAIRFGASEASNVKLTNRLNSISKFASFEYLPVALVIELRAVLRKFRSTVLIVIISALMTAVLVFSFSFIISITSIKQTIAMWGYDTSDLTTVVENMPDTSFADLKDKLTEDTRIKDYGMYSDINAVIPSEKGSEYGEPFVDSMSVLLSVVDGSYDDIGFTNIDGRNPVNGDEISIGVNIAKSYDKKIGDTLDVFIMGERCSFVITGIYQAISNMAYSGRICIGSVQNIDPNYNIKDVIFINLQEDISSGEFADEIDSIYRHSISSSTQDELINEVFSTAASLLILPLLIIVILFILIALIIIYCNCRINIKKESNTYGIYKSVGMRTSSIRLSISSGILVLEAVGALFGLIIGIGLLPNLLNIALSNYGIVNMPLVKNYVGIFFVIAIGVLSANIGAWFASKKISNTSPRILTVE